MELPWRRWLTSRVSPGGDTALNTETGSCAETWRYTNIYSECTFGSPTRWDIDVVNDHPLKVQRYWNRIWMGGLRKTKDSGCHSIWSRVDVWHLQISQTRSMNATRSTDNLWVTGIQSLLFGEATAREMWTVCYQFVAAQTVLSSVTFKVRLVWEFTVTKECIT